MVAQPAAGVCPMEEPASVVRRAHRLWDNADKGEDAVHEVTSYANS